MENTLFYKNLFKMNLGKFEKLLISNFDKGSIFI
ncbi:MAG: hypothetical protein ACI9XO_004452, partial [Paraglaciecola sp.]